jgi:hypothetical protein
MMAMTAENLDSKADIAIELAERDKRKALLEARIAELERMNAMRQDIIEILESRQNLPQEDKPHE